MLPDVVVAKYPALLPEGVEWDASSGRFLLSSLAEGSIVVVTDGGEVQTLIEDEGLVSSVGIQVDALRGRLLVANSDSGVFVDPAATGEISLGIYDLDTGERIHLVDLQPVRSEAGRHFANDVAVDADGNAYVTDSLAPVIYKVDPEGNASTFAHDARFENASFGLNGIEFHPDGFLLAGVTGDGTLYKIPLDDPEAVTAVRLDVPVYVDGMVLEPDGDLAAVNGRDAKVVVLRSDDGWATATHVGEAEVADGTTTVAVRGNDVYALSAHLGENPAPNAYEIVRVDIAEAEGAVEGRESGTAAESAEPDVERMVAPVVGAYAPDFVVSDVEGNEVSLEDYSGQIVLLNFWATWCHYCLGERPTLQAAYEEFGDEGLVILAVDIGDSKNSVAAVVEEHGLTFPTLLDEMRQVAQMYRIRAVPTTFVIDRDGMIVDMHIGPLTQEQIEEYVSALK